jgi:glucose dehydrogenase
LNAVVVAGLLAQFVAFHTTLAQNPVASAADWPVYNRSYSGERHSPLRQLTPANVARLRRVCTFDTKEQVGFQTGRWSSAA